MKRLCFITVVFFVFFAVNAKAQGHGGVTVHSDPRLGLLLKKNYAVASVAKSPKPHKVVSATDVPASTPKADKAIAVKTDKTPKPVWSVPVVSRKGGTISSGKGFRVQIYNGPDRSKAIDIKNEFMRRYPGVRTYLSYISPSFRVKVGNYRRRSDAEGMYKEARSAYTPCMIVPDIITISTF